MSEKNKKNEKIQKTEANSGAGKVEKVVETPKGEVKKEEATPKGEVKKEEVAVPAKEIKGEAPPVAAKPAKPAKPKFRNLGLTDHNSIFLRDRKEGDLDLNGKPTPTDRLTFVVRTKTNEDIPVSELPAMAVIYAEEDGFKVAYKEAKIRKSDVGKEVFDEKGEKIVVNTYKQHTVLVESDRTEEDKSIIKVGLVGRWDTNLTQADHDEIADKAAADAKRKEDILAKKETRKKEKEAEAKKKAQKAIADSANKDTKADSTEAPIAPGKTEKEEVNVPTKAEKTETAKS